jgi:hypothetical protein
MPDRRKRVRFDPLTFNLPKLSCASRTKRPVEESCALVVEEPSFALDAAAVAR